MNVLVRPLAQEWVEFLGDAAERDLMNNLTSLINLWETEGSKVVESFPEFSPPRDFSPPTELSALHDPAFNPSVRPATMADVSAASSAAADSSCFKAPSDGSSKQRV